MLMQPIAKRNQEETSEKLSTWWESIAAPMLSGRRESVDPFL
jgi:hypothetical protein